MTIVPDRNSAALIAWTLPDKGYTDSTIGDHPTDPVTVSTRHLRCWM
ncbi:hypothetical protein Rhow_000769 [Rhodococcus wratislaviensis]|uniref:Uncharacterized protein n=1 Tax=Rhodococcus wratislaviensis TaxID=44752 RepID=A0A402C2Q7_RHOWR|nr:hypothetical protein Rhow_000769 [Rhodococcus wratislaviensis]